MLVEWFVLPFFLSLLSSEKVKIKGKAFPVQLLKRIEGVEVQHLHSFLTFTRDGGKWINSHPGRYPRQKAPVRIQ
jgi:hypothetical protein